MTELEWLTSQDPRAMLHHLTEVQVTHPPERRSAPGTYSTSTFAQVGRLVIATDRKLRLFAEACCEGTACKAIHQQVWQSVSAKAVARHGITHTAPGHAAALLRDIIGNPFHQAILRTLTPTILSLARTTYEERAKWCCVEHGIVDEDVVYEAEEGGHGHAHCWKAALPINNGMLDYRKLAILSDALEEAGCDNTTILDHLRSLGPHVRGCWAVNLILGEK